MTRKLLSSMFFAMLLGACQPSTQSPKTPTLVSHPRVDRQGIINGEAISSRRTAAARSVVLLDFIGSQGQSVGFCSGALISDEAVLTAGHCFDKKVMPGVRSFRVIFEDGSQFHRRQGLKGLPHLAYNSSGNYDHDIALAFFSGGLPRGFSPVAYDQNLHADYSNDLIYVYGYGRTRDVGQGGNSSATGSLHRGILQVDSSFRRLPDRYMTDPSVPVYTCYGDSGGPQFHHENGVLKIIGVSSAVYGKKAADGNNHCVGGRAQATKVSYFASWIRKELHFNKR